MLFLLKHHFCSFMQSQNNMYIYIYFFSFWKKLEQLKYVLADSVKITKYRTMLRFGRLPLYKECVRIQISKTVSICNFSSAHVFISLAHLLKYTASYRKKDKEKMKKKIEIIVFLKEWFSRDTCGFPLLEARSRNHGTMRQCSIMQKPGVLKSFRLHSIQSSSPGGAQIAGYPGGGLGRLSLLLQSGRVAGGCSLKWVFWDPIRWLVVLIHGQPKI